MKDQFTQWLCLRIIISSTLFQTCLNYKCRVAEIWYTVCPRATAVPHLRPTHFGPRQLFWTPTGMNEQTGTQYLVVWYKHCPHGSNLQTVSWKINVIFFTCAFLRYCPMTERPFYLPYFLNYFFPNCVRCCLLWTWFTWITAKLFALYFM